MDDFILIDEMHRLIKVEEDIVDVSEIIGFDLVEDGTSITQGGLGAVGMSLAGGALFGKQELWRVRQLVEKRPGQSALQWMLLLFLRTRI